MEHFRAGTAARALDASIEFGPRHLYASAVLRVRRRMLCHRHRCTSPSRRAIVVRNASHSTQLTITQSGLDTFVAGTPVSEQLLSTLTLVDVAGTATL
jgi:hypothetical protein